MDRLSTLDAEFLHIEDGSVQMAIAGACVFADPPPTLEDLEGLVAAKLHRIPRYRQRVRTVPFELGRPVWVDDPDFDLGYHVRHTALPGPGDNATFCRLMARIMSQPLDRDRPLWEMWLVEGVAEDRWAIIFKVHHCMVDGIAGVGLLTVLLDPQPGAAVGDPEPWEPAPEPAGADKVLAAWAGLVSDLASWARAVPAAAAHPVPALRSGVDVMVGGLRSRRLLPTSPLTIEGPIGPHRSWAHASADLEAVRTVRLAFGGTVNDVVLAAVAGGYRELLARRGDDVGTAVVRSLVPVSTRREDGRGVADNRVSALLCELPVDVADPVGRLEVVQARMAALKASHIAEAGEAVAAAGDLVPPVVLDLVSHATMRSMRRFGQRSLNTVTTNVPGPQVPLYCLDHEMLEYRPYVPISHGLRVGTAILSYNGRLFFGVTGDFRTTPDVAVVASGAAAGIGELAELALERMGDHRPS